MACVLGHAWLWWHAIRGRATTTASDVVLVSHMRVEADISDVSNIWHVAGGHVSLRGHAGSLLWRQVLTSGLFGRVDLICVVHAILVAGRGLGGV